MHICMWFFFKKPFLFLLYLIISIKLLGLYVILSYFIHAWTAFHKQDQSLATMECIIYWNLNLLILN